VTGPLAQQFAQVRETLEFGYGGDPNYRPYYEEGIAALSAIERHVQDMEKALEEIPGKPPYRIAGIPSGIISADDWDVTDEVLAFLAALPAREGIIE
jgi:hypothetical protein